MSSRKPDFKKIVSDRLSKSGAETIPKTSSPNNDSTIQSKIETPVASADYILIEVNVGLIKIEDNIRSQYNEESIKELAASIEKNGLINPPTLTPYDDPQYWKVVVGHRRTLAVISLRWAKIPAFIKKNISKREIVLQQLIENIQREDLHSVDEAIAMKQIMVDFSINQTELAGIIGKSKQLIANTLGILRLTEKVSRVILSRLSKRQLIGLSQLSEKPYFEKVLEAAENGASYEDIIRLAKELDTGKHQKNRDRIRKDLEGKFSEIVNHIQGLHDMAMKFRIQFGKDIPPEYEAELRQTLIVEINRFLVIIGALFKGKTEFEINVKGSPLEPHSSKIPFLSSNTLVNLSTNLNTIGFTFISYNSTITEVKQTIMSIIPKLNESLFDTYPVELLIDHWNALPWQTIKKEVVGFYFNSVSKSFVLPKSYLEIKEKYLADIDDSENIEKKRSEGYSFNTSQKEV